MQHADVLFGSDLGFAAALGVNTQTASEPDGQLLQAVLDSFPELKIAVATRRHRRSATHHDWSVPCRTRSALFTGPTFFDYEVLDGIGSGDPSASGFVLACSQAPTRRSPWAMDWLTVHLP